MAQAMKRVLRRALERRRDRESRNEDQDAAQSAVVQCAPYDFGAGEEPSVRRPAQQPPTATPVAVLFPDLPTLLSPQL